MSISPEPPLSLTSVDLLDVPDWPSHVEYTEILAERFAGTRRGGGRVYALLLVFLFWPAAWGFGDAIATGATQHENTKALKSR